MNPKPFVLENLTNHRCLTTQPTESDQSLNLVVTCLVQSKIEKKTFSPRLGIFLESFFLIFSQSRFFLNLDFDMLIIFISSSYESFANQKLVHKF